MEYRLVDEITFKLADEATDAPTATAILGPFFRADTPFRSNGENIVKTVPKDGKGEIAFMNGRVMDFETKKPLVGAVVEVWQASTNGLYEQQDSEQEEFNLRGKFKTDENGLYSFYCLRPTPYPVPDDGPAGKLLKLMDRHPFRPAHIHIIVCLSPSPLKSLIGHGANAGTGNIRWLQAAHNPDLRPQGSVPDERLGLRGEGFAYR